MRRNDSSSLGSSPCRPISSARAWATRSRAGSRASGRTPAALLSWLTRARRAWRRASGRIGGAAGGACGSAVPAAARSRTGIRAGIRAKGAATSACVLRPAEGLDPLHPEALGPLAQRQAQPHLGEVAAEDVLAVVGALHPALHDLLDGELPLGDVLADGVPLVAGVQRPLAYGPPFRARMGEIAAGQHVPGVALRRLVEAPVGGEWSAPGRPALGVDPVENGPADGGDVLQSRGATLIVLALGDGEEEGVDGVVGVARVSGGAGHPDPHVP